MNRQAEFQDKVVLIAGLSSKVSGATALAFAREGASLILADRNETNASSVIESIQKNGGKAIFEQTNLNSEKEVAALLNKITQIHGRIHIACNDSNVIPSDQSKKLSDIDEKDWDEVIDTHLKTIWICMRHELLKMRLYSGCTIVNSLSMLGHSGRTGMSVYSAAHHGVIGLTQAAARQYGLIGIRINAICPSLQAPVESIVETILWLSSGKSSYVNGQAIIMNGGA